MVTCSYTTPPSMLTLAVDKLSSELFNIDEDELNVMVKNRNKIHKFIETEPRYEEKSSKKTNEAATKFQLMYHDDVDGVFTLSFFDQIVMSACMTEYLQGNTIITPSIIYRDLGGSRDGHVFWRDQIVQSIHKLANLEIRLDAKDASKFLFQVKGDSFDDIRYGFVLPAEDVTARLNGQLCAAYRLYQKSVVFEYAQCKGHLVHLPVSHLVVPHTKNTLEFMLLKVYIYTRVLRIQRKLAHFKKRQPEFQSIVLETMYHTCGFMEQLKHRKFRRDLLVHITRFMDHLVQLKVISSYQLVDDNKLPQRYLRNCRKILFVPTPSDAT